MIKKFALTLATFVAFALTVAPAAFAAEHEAASGITDHGIVALASALAIAVSAFGGALGQSRAAIAALDGMARNPSAAGTIQTAMIIALALIESLVIYGLVIAFFLQGKVAL